MWPRNFNKSMSMTLTDNDYNANEWNKVETKKKSKGNGKCNIYDNDKITKKVIVDVKEAHDMLGHMGEK